MTKFSLGEFIKYTGASACALAVDVAVLWMLARATGVHYLVAATAAFACGAAVAYWLCIKFVFSFRRIDKTAPEFGMFCAIGIFGLLVNTIVLGTAVGLFGIHLLVAKAGSAAITFLSNFAFRKLLLFSRLTAPAGVVEKTCQ